MSDHFLKADGDYIDAGHTPGETMAHYRDRRKGFGQRLQDVTQFQWVSKVSGLVNASGVEGQTDLFIAPFDLEFVSVSALRDGASADVATATLAVRASDNPLTATNIDIDGLTDVTVTDAPLSATPSKYKLSAGDRFKVTWATDSAGTITAACVVIKWKPIADAS